MKYLIILIVTMILSGCTSNINKNNNAGLQIDIYKNDMTYEKFKQKVIEYAENSPYPSLTSK